MSSQAENQEEVREEDRENIERRSNDGEPDLVLEPIPLPEEYIKPIVMNIPQLDLSAPSKINKIYYTVKVPEVKDLELEVNYGGLEAEVAAIRRERVVKREKFLTRLSVHFLRTSLCFAGSACIILGYSNSRQKLAAMSLAVIITMHVLMTLYCIWDLVRLKK